MRRLPSVLLILGAATCGAQAQTGRAAIQTGSDNQLYTTFQDWCGRAAPDFAALDKRASDSGLRVMGDNKTTQPDGTAVESKQWLYRHGSGQFGITATNAVKASRTSAACSVYFPGLSGATMPAYLSDTDRLGAPLKQSPDKTSTFWKGPFPGTQIRLDMRPSGQNYEGVLTIMQTESGN